MDDIMTRDETAQHYTADLYLNVRSKDAVKVFVLHKDFVTFPFVPFPGLSIIIDAYEFVVKRVVWDYDRREMQIYLEDLELPSFHDASDFARKMVWIYHWWDKS